MLVKIKRDTIKKNPNAHNTTTHVPGLRKLGFTYKGEIPEQLKPYIEITAYRIDSITGTEYEAAVLRDFNTVLNMLSGDKNASIEFEQDYVLMRHNPEPDYFYDYEDPELECSNCHSKVKLSDIYFDYYYTGEDDIPFHECPICEARNSFEDIEDLEYEEIEDVLKE